MNASIHAAGLGKRFSGAAADAVSGVELAIPPGCVAGLVGPDGAGKTTLLRMLAGLLTPSGGKARVAGLDPVAEGDALRRSIGYMPQKFGLYEDLTVQENLNLYADLREVVVGDRERDFARLLALTDLAAFTARPAGKLSGGMKQKLGLACSLLGRPRVLLLDEPGVGVDPISRRELWKLIRALSADGITVLLSTAYLDEAESCDVVYLMAAGRIRAGGSPADLTAPLAGRCLRLTGIAGNRRRLLQRLLRQPALMDGTIQGHSLRLLLRDAEHWPDLAAAEAGPDARLQVARPRLEDAFISLLGGGPGGDSALAAVMPDAPSRADEAVIEARRLGKCFGDFRAADDISFSVRRGEVFGLLGPNGAGKSTTFKMECGLLKPSEGQALVMGLDLKASPSAARQQLGYMAQKFSLYAQLTVRRNLMFFSGVYGLAGAAQRAKVAQMERVFGLSPYMDSPAGELPLGFKQRLALACAVMHEPPLLFLDEPTSGVDPVTRREFWTHINGLAEKGVTVLVTTHFMDEAEYCDRIALVYRGRLLALDTPDALKSHVQSPGLPDPTMEDAFILLVREADA
ncbi:multidrug ABC transporter ATP-binding protein [Chromobacterium violaceum]|uniref:ATP-binding cassette domain-containing protein n=1 Tax=Chromobacterium violaceum TaxID=536 RepID=UPI000C12830E|nr:ATP-binding cassette domain-containing protein [Chromobacterium violaceum]ATP28916.1 multidrug ABC transporter ATP-binding protein [Chromobacterium violaceum]ATP32826.1 multidrug ABC transporter ATP-binding protein [Chromobacterium violaceum]